MYVEKKLVRISAVYSLAFQILFKFKQMDLCWDDGLISENAHQTENNLRLLSWAVAVFAQLCKGSI